MQVGGPEAGEPLAGLASLAEADAAQVARQGIQPDVEDVVGPPYRSLREWHGDSPLDAGPADREIAQPGAKKGGRLIATRLGAQKLRVLAVVVEQGVLISRQAEEEVFLLGPLARLLMHQAQIARMAHAGLIFEFLAARAVPPG